MSFRRGKAPSGPWNRLKPVEQDPLESMGLPSKGDARLLEFKAQEKYYTHITERYVVFCSDAGQRDELLRRFSSLGLEDNQNSTNQAKQASIGDLSTLKDTADKLRDSSNTRTLSVIMAALRKLREGIVASKRADHFALQAYLFCIRLSILVKQPESYHPAILHLLRSIHPKEPLTATELQEVVSYLVLDTACRRRNLSEAFAIRTAYKLKDSKVNSALSALAHDNFVVFHRVRRTVDGHKARLMEWAEPELRLHTLKCFGRSYLSVDLNYLEQSTNAEWQDLKGSDSVGWDLDGSKVVIRKIRAK
ncbi:hypothetical protein Golomagni_06253 [Golovinomyces magnicellulatus]|nr:hypothetical protein Golomagni_06253 [Golovinomyces magnicellulatus]